MLLYFEAASAMIASDFCVVSCTAWAIIERPALTYSFTPLAMSGIFLMN